MSVIRYLCVAAVLLSIVVSAGAAETAAPKTVNDEFPGFATGALKNARLSDIGPEWILRCGAILIAQGDLDGRLQLFPPEIRPKISKDQVCLLEETATRMILYSEAYDWGKQTKSKLKADELVSAYLTSRSKNVTVPEADIRRFYDENKADMSDIPYEQVKDDIKKMLLADRRRNVENAYTDALGDRYDIEVDRAWAAKQYPIIMDNPVEKARKSGKPLLVDFGSGKCAPCRALAPILDEIKKEYAEKMDLLLVSVDDDPLLGARYGADSLPTQIFYDKTGKEILRHVGFCTKASLIARMAEIGVK